MMASSFGSCFSSLASGGMGVEALASCWLWWGAWGPSSSRQLEVTVGWSSFSQFMLRDVLLGGSSMAVAGVVGLGAKVLKNLVPRLGSLREVERCWRNLKKALSWAFGMVLPVLSFMLWASFLRISLLVALVLVR